MTKSYLLVRSFYGRLLIIVLLSLPLIMSSCVTQRNVEYLRDKNRDTKEFTESSIEEYRIKAGDELYIQINSLDDAAANIFGGTQQTMYMGAMQPFGASLISYSVDKDGLLVLPVIGKLTVQGMTIGQVSNMLRDSLVNILSQPVVIVKLVNRYLSVLGEVRNPGHFAYSQEKLTIFDAIGLAGDITEYGDRREVILTRNDNGKNIKINMNLTKSEILSSDYYLIRPNDIVYVKPLNRKFWGLRQFPYTVIFSTVTTGLLLYNVIK